MTRKRFIKLLMSHGESKRSAQQRAEIYNRYLCIPYKTAYAMLENMRQAQKEAYYYAKELGLCGLTVEEVRSQINQGGPGNA